MIEKVERDFIHTESESQFDHLLTNFQKRGWQVAPGTYTATEFTPETEFKARRRMYFVEVFRVKKEDSING